MKNKLQILGGVSALAILTVIGTSVSPGSPIEKKLPDDFSSLNTVLVDSIAPVLVQETNQATEEEKVSVAVESPKTLGSGTFQTVQVETSGSVKFVKTGDTQTIEISNLSTSSAPDLGIYLSKDNSITSSAAIVDSIKLTPLRSSNGSQTYTVPANIDLSQYKSIAIHCTQYNKLFGAASIK